MSATAPSSIDAPRQSLWRNPIRWLAEHNFSRSFWAYFTTVFFFDAGYGIYFFLFNLFLLDLGYSEKLMGWVGGAMTMGSVIVMMPLGYLAKRIGVKPLIVACFVLSPLINGLRTLWMWWPAQIGLALLAGMSMSLGTVCYLPAVARLTTDKNRTAAFSLIISASLGTSAFAGVICGFLPGWIAATSIHMRPSDLKRLILLTACGVVAFGLLPLLSLRFPEPAKDPADGVGQPPHPKSDTSAFLVRYLPLTALWAAVVTSFGPFGSVYLAKELLVPMSRIGIIYSAIQIIQLGMGLVAPILFRVFGIVNGIVAVQAATGVAFFVVASAHNVNLAIFAYLIVSALQWVSSPGLYDLVMTRIPDRDRNTAAAGTLLCNSVAASIATAGAGMLFSRYGYPTVLVGIGVLAMLVACLARVLLAPGTTDKSQSQPVLYSL